MELKDAIRQLKELPRKNDRVYIKDLNTLVKKIKTNHDLAIKLWSSGSVDAKELAVRIADHNLASEELLENWVSQLSDWGLTDAFTGHLVRYTPMSEKKAFEWANRAPEFEKRAGFALAAQMAWSKNNISDNFFIEFLSIVEREASDERFYVKKAINWVLRDIAKRNDNLRKHAQKTSKKLQQSQNRVEKWVGTHRSKEIFL